jgi:hypothetical protein
MTKTWTEAEELKLKALYNTASKQELIDEFKTDWNKIKDKAAKLGGLNRQKCIINEAELLADYQKELPIKEIWAKYGISNPTLIKILRKNSIRKRNNSLDNLNIEEFKKEYGTLTIKDIVAKYGVSRPTIRAKAKELGLIRPEVFLYKQPTLLNREKEICDKYVNNPSSMQLLADEYKVTTSTIFNLLHKHNIEIKEGTYGATQKQIQDWIKQETGLEFESNNRTILDGKEIDLYNDALKVGIEYCGLYWHSERNIKNNNYHFDKYKACKDKGIHLITMYEDEWVQKQEQVKGVLLSILHKNSRKIYGRKCTTKMIDKTVGNAFYAKYHIQGKASLSVYFAGLYYGDELVGVMSFGRHHRDTTKYTLDRLCFKRDVSIAGGSDKLFKYLVRETGMTELISWSDSRWRTGKVYEKLGFIKDCEMDPDYSYVDNTKPSSRLSKQSQKKGNTNCPKGLTEKEWCIQRGLYRIWDCGKIRWTWKKQLDGTPTTTGV